jgi:hypothetical protein
LGILLKAYINVDVLMMLMGYIYSGADSSQCLVFPLAILFHLVSKLSLLSSKTTYF